MLRNICYVSSARERLDPSSIEEMLRQSRERNSQQDVTGVLLYCAGNFMQYLEGPPGAIEAIWRSILNDPRHAGIIELFSGPTSERLFAGWSMSFRALEPPQFDELLIARPMTVAPSTNARTPAGVAALLWNFWRTNMSGGVHINTSIRC